MYPGVELRLYRYVSVLAEELNFTQAAIQLHVSQPTLSNQIRELERELDVKLFERKRGSPQLVLTSSGEAFAAQARLTLLHADRAIQAARNAPGRQTATLNLGYSPLIDFRVVSKVRHYLSTEHPAAAVRFVSGHTAEHVDGLIRGRLDAGLVILPAIESRLTFNVLHRERLVLALPEQHSLAKKKHIEVTDLHQLPLVKIRGDIEPRFGNSLKRLFSIIQVQPQIIHEVTTQAEALEIVSHEGLAAITTSAAMQGTSDQIVFRNFLDEVLTVETSLAYCGEPTSPILKSLLTFLSGSFEPLSNEPEVRRKVHQLFLF
ncbi:MAG: LysR substrate-binding domain-containing protein [Candidatus Acidiferrum sp.]